MTAGSCCGEGKDYRFGPESGKGRGWQDCGGSPSEDK